MTTHTALKPSKPADIGLKEDARTAILAILDRTLADEAVLSVKTRNFHWNVTGFHFSAMHKFFEEQYTALDGIIDETAERARALGGRSLGSMKEFLGRTRLAEAPARDYSEGQMVAALLADHASLIKSLRADVDECARLGDAGTADFLTGLLAAHEKMAWMLRSYVS